MHDLGGPVGFDLIRRSPERILSLTVLNTLVNVSRFSKPRIMRPFEYPVIGNLWTAQMNSPRIVPFFRWKGVMGGPSYAEIRAYGTLLTRGDRGKAFRKIMSSFETTDEFEQRILPGLSERAFPAQVIWGTRDSELTVDHHGVDARVALELETDIYAVDAKHFLQEDVPVEIVGRVAKLVVAGHDI